MPSLSSISSDDGVKANHQVTSTGPPTNETLTPSSSRNNHSKQFKTIYLEGSSIPVKVRPHNWLISKLFRTKTKPVPETRRQAPKSYKNPISLMTWEWLSPLLLTGFDRLLEINDIFLIDDKEQNARRMADYHKKLRKYKAHDSRASYAEFRAMMYALRWNIIWAMATTVLYVAGELGMSLMSRNLIDYVNDIYTGETTKHGHAVAFTIGLVLVQVGFQFFFVWNGFRTRALAEISRTMLISAVFDKVTKLSPQGRQQYSAGKITSIVTTDTNRIFMAARWTCMVIIFLPAFGAMLGILFSYLGVSSLPGCGLVLLGIVCNVGVSRVLTFLRRKSLPFADSRIATVRETVENMRVIKFYGWESSFVKMVSKARAREVNYLIKLGMLEGLVDATLTSIPQFGGILSFAVRIITGHNLSANVAFPALTLFQLFVPLSMMFSAGITSHADAWASVKRLDDFFQASEEPSYVITENVEPGKITISDGFFKWDSTVKPSVASTGKWKRRLLSYKRRNRLEDEAMPAADLMLNRVESARDGYEEMKEKKEQDEIEENQGIQRAGAQKFPGLMNVNIDVKPKELVMIVGSIGTGKTTLLSSIAGLVSKDQGTVHVGGNSATVMSMWSQNATIRDNILFGRAYDEERYAKTVYVCNLDSDFANFAGRDFAEVGERGITLSGGQKARIALARCVYAGGDVILLDDVLSAVDGKVANHIFVKCIQGMLRNSTRLMVTHNLNLLPKADRIVYMDGTGNVTFGTLDELITQNPKFKAMYRDATNTKDNEEEIEEEHLERNLKVEGYEDYEISDDRDSEFKSDSDSIDSLSIKPQLTSPSENDKAAASLTKDEGRMEGTIKFSVLYEFLSSGGILGIWMIPVIMLIQACVAAAQVMQSVFMQFWTENKYNQSSGFYIGFYCLIVFLRAVFFVAMAVSICIFCFNSSSKLHNQAVETIYKAPMAYFDSTPLGRIINRFTDDTANLDTQLFMQLRMTLFFLSMLIASLIVVFVYVPWSILALVPIFVIGFILLNYYRASARELKRINSLFRGSMFTLVTETISGLPVILSYKRQEEFSQELNRRIDDMNVSFQINLASQYWLSLRSVGSSIPISLIVILLAVFQVFNLNASKTGMLLSIIPSVSISVVSLLPMLAELENQMNSVERLHELAYELPQEAPFTIPENAPPASWPDRGEIEFQNACLRYRPGLPTVLNNLSIKVSGGEKVGICGRTGAGKSTILAALFRINELYDGKIIIDGIDISTIGLRDLRTKLAIIPQEPVLFQGTIRSNLDPFNEHDDLELWDALRRSGVVRYEEVDQSTKQVSKDHRFHLDTKTDSEGSNFSLGERQLLTLARALVRNAQIIVLDEATATVDFETDKIIQQTITKEFSHCTILCIAHRLQTIVNYDRVLVMDSGSVAEIASPKDLYNDKSSRFASMCEESGITESDFI